MSELVLEKINPISFGCDFGFFFCEPADRVWVFIPYEKRLSEKNLLDIAGALKNLNNSIDINRKI